MGTDWLPDLELFAAHGGDWNAYVDHLHSRFCADFINSTPTWPSKRVGVKRHPYSDGKCATFWHLISTGSVEADRTPDMRRCERIGWPRPVIDEFDDATPGATSSRIVWWMEQRGGEDRYLLAPDDFSYLVVVADRGEYVLPWTAFWLEHAHQRRKRRKAFETYWGR